MKYLLFLFLFILSRTLDAQEDFDLERFVEKLFQIQDEDLAYEELYESLFLYYSHPLDLNKAEPEELASLYILSLDQLSNFFLYRATYGDLLSIYELQAIPSFDLPVIKNLLPFVEVRKSTMDPRSLFQRIGEEENNYLLLRFTQRLEEQFGYTPAMPLDTVYTRDEVGRVTDTLLRKPNRYFGTPTQVYGRFRVARKDDFSLGITFEKDAGETFTFDKKTNGFDFYSYHILLEEKIGFKRIMVGDYQIQVGQGLVFGSGFGTGKGVQTIYTVKQNTVGIRPYTSVLESGFFRGFGLTKVVNNLEFTGFYSAQNLDGNIQSDTTFSDFDEYVNAIQNTGFHRTHAELVNKDVISEKNFGGVVQWKNSRSLRIGLTALSTQYNVAIQRRPNNYNQFEFGGRSNHIYSAYFTYSWQNFIFFGEGAQSKSGGIGTNGGFMASLSPQVDFALLLRNYDKDFHSFYGRGFSEGARNINERGTYWGLSFRPSRQHQFNVYYDKFRFPWLRFGAEAPSEGYEYLGRYTYNPSKQTSLYVQIRTQQKQVTMAEGNLNILVNQIKQNYIFNIDYALRHGLKMRSRVQSSHLSESGIFTSGFAMIQDVHFELWKLKFYTRVALFDSDNFENRQYVYENDVLYAFSLPAYSGTGLRNYIMVRYDPTRKLSLWLRYAQTRYPSATAKSEVGSGLERSEGDTASEIKAMLRIKF